MLASPHPRQPERLAALRSFDILDTPREDRFDDLVQLAAELCDAPVALIGLIDVDRHWFKAEVGAGMRQSPLETSLCAHAILQPGLTVIPDTLADPRTRDNPLCVAAPNLRFYAGAPLTTDDGLPLGTLCVFDVRPRDLDQRQRRALAVLADQVMAQMQLRRELRLANDLRREVDHRVKNSLGLVGSLLSLQAGRSTHPGVTEALTVARDRIAAIASLHEQLQQSGSAAKIDFGVFAERLAQSLGAQVGGEATISARVPPVEMKVNDAIDAAIVLNELVTNALRHGLRDGAGAVAIEGRVTDGGLTLSVADSGRGLPEGFDAGGSAGLGMRIAQALARKLRAALAWSSDARGATFSFTMPLTKPD